MEEVNVFKIKIEEILKFQRIWFQFSRNAVNTWIIVFLNDFDILIITTEICRKVDDQMDRGMMR